MLFGNHKKGPQAVCSQPLGCKINCGLCPAFCQQSQASKAQKQERGGFGDGRKQVCVPDKNGFVAVIAVGGRPYISKDSDNNFIIAILSCSWMQGSIGRRESYQFYTVS
jgi:hypothetical protein